MNNIALFVISFLGVWISSAGVDVFYLPIGPYPMVFVVVIVSATSIAISVFGLRVALLKWNNLSLKYVLTVSASLMVLCSLLEIIYFNIIPDDHEMIRREIHGAWCSPLVAISVLSGSLSSVSKSEDKWTIKRCVLWAGSLSLVGAAVISILLPIRNSFRSVNYFALDASMFAIVLVCGAMSVAMLTLRLRRS